MAPPSIWATRLRYALTKMEHSAADSLMRYHAGEIRFDEFAGCFCKSFFRGKLTSAHWAYNGRREMAPTLHNDGAAILVRRLLDYPNPIGVFVGDLVMVRDPERPSQFLTRRLAAIEGCEMVSTDEKDEPFILPHNYCWVLADNQSLTPKVADNQSLTPKIARDSRLFGPVPLSYIHGRVIYTVRTSADHGPVQNSCRAMEQDSPVVAVELDLQTLVNIVKMRLKE